MCSPLLLVCALSDHGVCLCHGSGGAREILYKLEKLLENNQNHEEAPKVQKHEQEGELQ